MGDGIVERRLFLPKKRVAREARYIYRASRANWNWARAYQMTVQCPSFKRLKTIAYLLQASYLMLL